MFEIISRLLLYLEKKKYSITVYDFNGDISKNPTLSNLLSSYSIHNNDFCRYLKSFDYTFRECIMSTSYIREACLNHTNVFPITHHCGLLEYVIPIYNNTILIGALTIGLFYSEDESLEKKMNVIKNKEPKIRKHDMLARMKSSAMLEKEDLTTIFLSLEMAVQYIQQQSSCQENPIIEESNLELYEQIQFYLQDNYTKNVTINDIADVTNYSVSYISHKFKDIMGMNLKTYINALRIEASKAYLANSTLSISKISDMLGYMDSSYFCKVFSYHMNLSPSEFRKNMHQDSHHTLE